jgi:large subunit ribosomal protein L24
MAVMTKKKEKRYTPAAIKTKVRPGGRRVVSTALIKPGTTNLVPKMHVKRGDMVMLISGPQKNGKYEPDMKKRLDERNAYKGQIGKVASVSRATGKITIEGVNMVTRAQKQRGLTQAGLVRKEAPIFASRVMLYCSACKKPTRAKHKVMENGKKARVCRHCSESFDT